MRDASRVFPEHGAEASGAVLKVELPLYLRGSQNIREHWAARSRRVKTERQTARLLMTPAIAMLDCPESPVITITRYGSVLIRDDDNLRAACKAVRDGIADALGVDDGDPRLTWEYKQGRSRRGQERVEVEIA